MADATAAIVQPDRLRPRTFPVPIAASTTLYPGIGISLNSSGYAQQMGDDASTRFLGVMEPAGQDTIVNVSNGDSDVLVRVDGLAQFAASAADQSWVGQVAYATDNQTVAVTGVTNNLVVGRVVRIISSSKVEVWLAPAYANPTPLNDAGTTYTQTYSTADRTVASPTAGALTDNTTGAAGTTFAAGAGVYDLVLVSPSNLSTLSTGGVDVATGIVLGHKFKILSWEFITTVAGTGAAASLVFNLEIQTTDVGTTPSTCTVTLAGTDTIGKRTAGTAVSGANTGSATDALSLEVAGSGTAFTAGMGYWVVKVQNMDTADAVASLIAEHAKLVADDLDNRKTITALIDDLQAIGAVG